MHAFRLFPMFALLLTCLTVVGWYREAVRMCGVKDVSVVEEECRASGGAMCRYRVSWS